MFFAGQRMTAQDLNDEIGYLVRQTSSLVKTNSTAFTSSSDLVVPCVSGRRYLIETCIYYSAGTTGDAKFNFSHPGGTMNLALWGSGTGTSAIDSPIFIDRNTLTSLTMGGAGTSVIMSSRIVGTYNCTSSGNVTFQWAQNTSNGSPTTLEADSWVRFTRYSM